MSQRPARHAFAKQAALAICISQPALYAAVGAVILGCFVADVILPRGATPAIGYSLVPLLSIRTRRRWFILLTMAICTFLTWVGYYLESAGAPAWMSVFERSMVTGVLWLTFAICWQRMRNLMTMEQLSRDLASSNAALEVFASVVAHDLRSPLSAISLFTDLLRRRCPNALDPECAESFSSIRSEVDRMSSLIEHLLACGRAGQGRPQATSDSEPLLDKVLVDVRVNLRESGGQVTHDPLPTVVADPIQISQLLQNLIENAIKFRGERPPHVHVAARRNRGNWVFSVRDNGIGIKSADAQRIFGWRERGHDAERARGEGIGLATCKTIVERHGGRIWAEPNADCGSTFYFTLPAPASPNGSEDRKLIESISKQKQVIETP